MTVKQDRLLRWEESQWRLRCRAAGRSCDDQARHALYRAALGYDKSSRGFQNHELTKVLGALRAFTRPDDLNEQIRVDAEPGKMAEAALAKCHVACDEMRALGKEFPGSNWDYICGTAVNIIGRPADRCDAGELYKVQGALAAQLKREKARKADLAYAPGEDPF